MCLYNSIWEFVNSALHFCVSVSLKKHPITLVYLMVLQEEICCSPIKHTAALTSRSYFI